MPAAQLTDKSKFVFFDRQMSEKEKAKKEKIYIRECFAAAKRNGYNSLLISPRSDYDDDMA